MIKRGDIVSRINEDEHLVIGINQTGDMICVECIKPDSGGCFKVGDTEWNLTRRYEVVRNAGDYGLHQPVNTLSQNPHVMPQTATHGNGNQSTCTD